MTENQPGVIAEDARQIISHMQAAQSALEGLDLQATQQAIEALQSKLGQNDLRGMRQAAQDFQTELIKADFNEEDFNEEDLKELWDALDVFQWETAILMIARRRSISARRRKKV